MRYSEAEIKKDNVIFGRVAEYDCKKGFGQIYSEDRKDVFLSSYDLGKLEKKIAVGSILKFNLVKRADKICATNIEVVDLLPNGRTFVLPNKTTVYIRLIKRFGIVSGEVAAKQIGISEKELTKHGYTYKDIEYLYIVVLDEEYRFFNIGSPVTCDGQLDVEEYFATLREKFFYLA